jgi:hypothetical protein
MKRATIYFGLLVGATCILSACGGLPSNAPIDDRTNPIKSKNQTTKPVEETHQQEQGATRQRCCISKYCLPDRIFAASEKYKSST